MYNFSLTKVRFEQVITLFYLKVGEKYQKRGVFGGQVGENTFLGPQHEPNKPCLVSAMFVAHDRLKELNQVKTLKIKELSRLIV